MKCNMFSEKECHVQCKGQYGTISLEYCRQCMFDRIERGGDR